MEGEKEEEVDVDRGGEATVAPEEEAAAPASSGSRAQSSAGTESSTAETGDPEEVIYAHVRPNRVPESDVVSCRSGTSTAVTNHLGQTDRDTKIITLSSLTMDENNE